MTIQYDLLSEIIFLFGIFLLIIFGKGISKITRIVIILFTIVIPLIALILTKTMLLN